jgi:hypothetical protein
MKLIKKIEEEKQNRLKIKQWEDKFNNDVEEKQKNLA